MEISEKQIVTSHSSLPIVEKEGAENTPFVEHAIQNVRDSEAIPVSYHSTSSTMSTEEYMERMLDTYRFQKQ